MCVRVFLGTSVQGSVRRDRAGEGGSRLEKGFGKQISRDLENWGETRRLPSLLVVLLSKHAVRVADSVCRETGRVYPLPETCCSNFLERDRKELQALRSSRCCCCCCCCCEEEAEEETAAAAADEADTSPRVSFSITMTLLPLLVCSWTTGEQRVLRGASDRGGQGAASVSGRGGAVAAAAAGVMVEQQQGTAGSARQGVDAATRKREREGERSGAEAALRLLHQSDCGCCCRVCCWRRVRVAGQVARRERRLRLRLWRTNDLS